MANANQPADFGLIAINDATPYRVNGDKNQISGSKRRRVESLPRVPRNEVDGAFPIARHV